VAGTITLTQICDGVEAVLGAAIGVQSSTSFDELTEGIVAMDCPRIEVFPDAGTCDPSGTTDRTTFNACTQMCVVTIFADLYARQRSQLGEDMKATTEMIDSIIDALQTQEKPPFFGLRGIKAFSWRWKRSTFRRADARYVGARFTLQCKIY
jgi:hypothetical protein